MFTPPEGSHFGVPLGERTKLFLPQRMSCSCREMRCRRRDLDACALPLISMGVFRRHRDPHTTRRPLGWTSRNWTDRPPTGPAELGQFCRAGGGGPSTQFIIRPLVLLALFPNLNLYQKLEPFIFNQLLTSLFPILNETQLSTAVLHQRDSHKLFPPLDPQCKLFHHPVT